MESVKAELTNTLQKTMALKKETKQTLIKKYKKSDNDTGSANVQIALLSERINILTEHLKIHAKDFHSRRGLLHLVHHRRKLLSYLHKKDEKSYNSIVKKLKLKG